MQRTIRQPRAMPLGAAALLAAARQYNARPNDSPPRLFLPILSRLLALRPRGTPDLALRAWLIITAVHTGEVWVLSYHLVIVSRLSVRSR